MAEPRDEVCYLCLLSLSETGTTSGVIRCSRRRSYQNSAKTTSWTVRSTSRAGCASAAARSAVQLNSRTSVVRVTTCFVAVSLIKSHDNVETRHWMITDSPVRNALFASTTRFTDEGCHSVGGTAEKGRSSVLSALPLANSQPSAVSLALYRTCPVM